MDDSRLVFGIDLGTTYSCVAQVDKFDQAIVLKNFEGNNTTPSVVYFGDSNSVIVGYEAKELSKLEPEKTVSFVKRSISTDDAYNKPTKFPQGLDPTEISAYILKKIVKDANDAAQNPEEVKKVVITCPAYFGTKERLRTKQAGEIAGLDVIAVINEPTAAAIAYGMKVEEQKVILVYDLGGGTFDVTMIKVNGGTITVIATGGDHHLGGVDWDVSLAEYLLIQYNKEQGTSYKLDDNPQLRNQLILLAEEKKKSLSARNSVNVPFTFEGKTSRIELTRETFDSLTEFKLDETIDKTKDVLKVAADKGFAKPDEVLLVGGSSRMPQIKARVDKELGCDAKLTDPDECVAKGAAIYALNESFSQAMEEYADGNRDEKPQGINAKTKTRVINVTSKNYGEGYRDTNSGRDMVQNMIFADTPLDGHCRNEANFSTSVDNQDSIPCEVYESDVRDNIYDAALGSLLESYKMPLTKRWPRGTSIKTVYEVDVEGILHVHNEIGQDILDFELKLKGVKDDAEMEQAKTIIAKSRVE